MADPVFRSSSTNLDVTLTATSLAVTNPSGLTDGDGQYIWCGAFTVGGGSPVLTPPSGWTVMGQHTFTAWGGIDGTVELYQRIASSDGTATVTSDRAAILALARCAYQFPHPTAWDSGITEVFGTTASGTSHVSAGITTTQNRQLVTWLFLGSTGSTWTSPGTVTERIDLGSGVSFMVSDSIETAAGATGTRTFTSSATVEGRYGVAAFNGRPDRFPSLKSLQAVNRAGTF